MNPRITAPASLIGKARKGAIVRADERITKLRRAYPVNSKHKDQVPAAISTLLKAIQGAVNAITYEGSAFMS